MNAREVADALKGKKRRKGWQATCPAHDDRKPSLSIDEQPGNPDGVLLHCHAGCSFESIIAAIPGFNSGGTKPTFGKASKKIAATYSYPDKDGKEQYQTVRYEPKDFKQRRPDGAGGYIWNLENTPRVLYRLPELIKADPKKPVWKVEGERDADRLAALGWVATTSVCGSKAPWLSEYSEVLRGRHVVILPDNDEPGAIHAEQVALSLKGIAKSIRIVNLPDMQEGGDVSDYLNAGHKAEELWKLARSTPEYAPAYRILKGFNSFTSEEITDGEEICFEACRGEVVLVAAVTNQGKSTLVRNVSMSLASGRPFPPFAKDTTPRRVILLNFEGPRSRFQSDVKLMAERLDDAERHLLNENLKVSHAPEINGASVCLSQANHFNALYADMEAFCPDVLVIDTLMAAFRIIEERSNSELTETMKKLSLLARKLNCVVILLHHIGKEKSEAGATRIEAHKARGASAIGDQSAAIWNVEYNSSTKITTVTCGKRKSGEDYQVTINLNRQTRWFESTTAPDSKPKPISSTDRVLQLIYNHRNQGPVKTGRLEQIIGAAMSRRTMYVALDALVSIGLVSQPVRGQWELVKEKIEAVERRLGISCSPLSTDTQLHNGTDLCSPCSPINDLHNLHIDYCSE